MAHRSTTTPPTPATAAKTPARRLRRDAQRNRDAIMAVARTAFAEQGLNASLEGIARQAGVAIGTLYRHFPTRLDLVEALFTEKFTEWVETGERAAAMDDAWQAFCLHLEKFCELQARDRAFNELASTRLPLTAVTGQVRDRAHELTHQILHNAQRQGMVRDDITPEDFAFIIWSQAGIIQATCTVAPNAWRRHLHLMLDAFRADRAHPLPEPPLTPSQVDQTLTTVGGCTE
ncbi:TetR family transcriptional regulator [Streptomyces albospinus]|uniref:TetR family transcriptional regulator n=1 Tax=Streptomyces albospinus TaxID=285515 RepID=A0ABQ2UNY7_9ACTN|nr:TetR/AcrR family transcriptional regulator [Streptomyces albospinus]GGU47088.1 TetR family transcriptional regulator [Streptomyces albospinus]